MNKKQYISPMFDCEVVLSDILTGSAFAHDDELIYDVGGWYTDI